MKINEEFIRFSSKNRKTKTLNIIYKGEIMSIGMYLASDGKLNVKKMPAILNAMPFCTKIFKLTRLAINKFCS